MPKLDLPNVPDRIYSTLQARAASHGRSVEEEALECLDAALRPPGESRDVEAVLDELRRFRESLGDIYLTEAELQCAKREGRP
jgi:plasmid stability protein